jgi:hypothetical protein
MALSTTTNSWARAFFATPITPYRYARCRAAHQSEAQPLYGHGNLLNGPFFHEAVIVSSPGDDHSRSPWLNLRIQSSGMGEHTHSEISQAWANAQSDLPKGWKVADLREHAQRFTPTAVAAEARARVAEYARADNASDPWQATARGPGDKVAVARGHDALDALDRLVRAVERASR